MIPFAFLEPEAPFVEQLKDWVIVCDMWRARCLERADKLRAAIRRRARCSLPSTNQVVAIGDRWDALERACGVADDFRDEVRWTLVLVARQEQAAAS